MGLLAAIFCGAAATYYPWPESENKSDTASKLFEEFENQPWTIKVSRYDRETERIKSFALRRKGLRWVIPSRSNFVATGTNVANVVNCLNQNEILVEQSEDQQDHERYGVLDPLEYAQATNRDAIGVKLSLEDVNRNTLGSLIVGDRVRDTQNQYYVRKPGQPKIYVIEFTPQIISTEFSNWLDPNLLNLRTGVNPEGATVSQIEIHNYRLSPEQLADKGRDYRYRARLRPLGQGVSTKLEIPSGDKWKTFNSLSNEQKELYKIVFQRYIRIVPVTDVSPKSKKLGEAMVAGLDQLTDKSFQEASKRGFRLSKTDDRTEIDGSNGKLSIQTTDGVEISVLFGGLAPTNESAADSLNYYVMITAHVMDAVLTEPEKPEPAEGEELSEQEAKDYAIAVKAWKAQKENAVRTTENFNKLHGEWYYVFNEQTLKSLRPEFAPATPRNE